MGKQSGGPRLGDRGLTVCPCARALGRKIKFADLADNEGTLQPNAAEMFQEACDEVREALDPDALKDWNV